MLNSIFNNSYVAFVEPYEKGLVECSTAYEDVSASLVERVTRFVVGIFLFIPLLNRIVLQIIQAPIVGWEELRWGDPHFSTEDIDFLAKKCLGLRHLSDKRTWLDESSWQGVPWGCSLSLAPHQAVFSKIDKKDWSEMSPADRQKLLPYFEKGVDNFINASLTYDFRFMKPSEPEGELLLVQDSESDGDLDLRVYSLVNHWANTCCFSIVKYESFERSVDHNAWGLGLGRFPKMCIKAEDITRVPIHANDFGFSKAELRSAITFKEKNAATERVWDRVLVCYRKAVIDSIRKMQIEN